MYTQAPEITIDATVGQVVVSQTATPSPTPVSSSVPTVTATPVYTFPPSPPSLFKRFRDNALIIYGYGPVNSKVTLKGFGVSEQTTTDANGLFIFNRIYSLSLTYPELCIQSVDNENRITQPSCIPALPNNSLIPLEVGPILLSPTVSLSNNRVVEGDEVILLGSTTPNTEVYVYFSKINNTKAFGIVKEVNAFNLPTIRIKSDKNGDFEIILPSSKSSDYRVFASSKYGEDLSAKSNTLQFSVVTSVKSFWEAIINFITTNKLLAVIIAEALIIVLLFILSLKSIWRGHKIHSEREYLEELKTL